MSTHKHTHIHTFNTQQKGKQQTQVVTRETKKKTNKKEVRGKRVKLFYIVVQIIYEEKKIEKKKEYKK